jgi:hypothetical protein
MIITATIAYVGLWAHLRSATTPGAGMKEIRAELLDRTGVRIRTLGVTKIVLRSGDVPIVIAKKAFAKPRDAIAFKLALEGGPFVVDLVEAND